MIYDTRGDGLHFWLCNDDAIIEAGGNGAVLHLKRTSKGKCVIL